MPAGGDPAGERSCPRNVLSNNGPAGSKALPGNSPAGKALRQRSEKERGVAGFAQNFLTAYGQALWGTPFLLLILLVGISYCYLYGDPVQAGSFALRQALRALPAGLAGSLLLVMAGIRAEAVTTVWLVPVTVLLAFWRPRFICLAYSGSVICFCRLAFGAPAVDVPQLMGLTALLHVMEGLLVLTDRGQGMRPRLFPAPAENLPEGLAFGKRPAAWALRRPKPGGAPMPPLYRKRYDLQRFWPLPLVLVTAVRLPAAGLPQAWAAVSEMPGWWPLLGREFLAAAADPQGLGGGLLLSLAPMATALGFCQSFPAGREKAGLRRCGLGLLLFSAVLFGLCWLADRFPAAALLQWWPPVFAILGHEGICRLQTPAIAGTGKKA